MKYTDVLRNEHFNNLASIIRVPFRSMAWKRQHADVPFWMLVGEFADAVKPSKSALPLDRQRTIKAITNLLITITQADDRLSYTPEDIDWFVSVLDMPDSEARAVLNLFSAWFSAADTYVTPTEVATATNTAESGWRNKAAAGEIPGAIKKGKQWLLPVAWLRSRGTEVPTANGE